MLVSANISALNTTQPHFDHHESIIINIRTDDCGFVPYVNYRERCEFVLENKNCRDNYHLLTYMKFMYCLMGTTTVSHGTAIFCLIAFMCYIFSLASETASRFVCPALAVLAKTMRMGEALAGVTLLAFGNGAFDLLGTWSDIHGDSTGIYASNFGCCVFILGFISAFVIIIRPFRTYQPYFVRDCIFLLFSTIYVNFIMRDGTVNLVESIFTVAIYFGYIVVITIDQIVLLRQARDLRRRIKISTESKEILKEQLAEVNANAGFEIYERGTKSVLDIKKTKSALFQGASANTKLFRQFFISLNPFRRDEWESARIMGKIVQLLKAPAIVLLLLIVPVVDFNENVHGWSKLLNTCQVLATPLILIFSLNYMSIPIVICVLAFGVPLVLIIFVTSRTDTPPVYHAVYGVLSVITCTFVSQILVAHISSILSSLGIALQTSESFLAVTISAWGSSLVAFFANVSLARSGYHKMGLAACFGGPIFNTTITFGFTFLFKCFYSPDGIANARKGALGSTIDVYLICMIFFALIGVLFTKNQVRKSLGIYLMCVYGMFIILIILIEFEFIHPYGTDHHDQRIKIESV